MDRRQFLITAAATMPLVAGCGGGGYGGGGYGGGGQQQQPQQDGGEQVDKTIVMKNTKFQTVKAEIGTGATVKWVNKDSYAHTVTSAQFHDTAKSWSFDKRVSDGGSVTHTFDSKGVYEYYCTVHGKGTMCGAVLVGGATLEKSLPCSGGNGGAY